MPQPGTLPRWAETASGTPASNLVGPPAGKQDAGFATGGDIPTSGGLNWLFRWIYKWCQYVAGLTGEALTWTARQTFSGGATVVDPPVNPTDAASMGYVDAEATARAAAVTAEASARTAADAAEAAARTAADSAEETARAATDALLMPKAGGTFTGPVAMPSLNAPAGAALAIGATDDHATTLNRNGIQALSLDSDAQGTDLLGLALGATTHIRNVRTPQFADWAANKGYVDALSPVLVCRVDGIETDRPLDGNGHRQPTMLHGSMNGGWIIGSNGSWTFHRPGLTTNAIITCTVCGTGQNTSPVSSGVSNLRADLFDLFQYATATDGSPILCTYDMAIVIWSL
jgi:hypothetical protein